MYHSYLSRLTSLFDGIRNHKAEAHRREIQRKGRKIKTLRLLVLMSRWYLILTQMETISRFGIKRNVPRFCLCSCRAPLYTRIASFRRFSRHHVLGRHLGWSRFFRWLILLVTSSKSAWTVNVRKRFVDFAKHSKKIETWDRICSFSSFPSPYFANAIQFQQRWWDRGLAREAKFAVFSAHNSKVLPFFTKADRLFRGSRVFQSSV